MESHFWNQDPIRGSLARQWLDGMRKLRPDLFEDEPKQAAKTTPADKSADAPTQERGPA